MREIKFRAWNKERQKILDVFDINFRTPATVQILDENYVLYDELFDCVELMQFTGMPDNEGNNVYEGDILLDENNYYWLVSFLDGKFIAHVPDTIYDFVNLDDYQFKVAGNIHQHAHLLEQTKC